LRPLEWQLASLHGSNCEKLNVNATFGGGTKVAGEIELEWMLWPSAERKFGWFVAPTNGYSFSKGHEQFLGITTGLIIAIH
jgi:hypothetical protein